MRMKKLRRQFKKLCHYLSEAHVIFLVVAIPATIGFISIVPPAWGLDEQVHIARVYQVSQGDLYPNPIGGEGRFGGMIPKNLEALISYGHFESNTTDRNKQYFERRDISNEQINNRLESMSMDERNMVQYDFGPTGPYTPIVYSPAAIGMKIGDMLNLSVGQSISLAKIFQATMFIALCYFAIRNLAMSKSKWLILLIALLPASIYQAATINADAFTIAVSLLFFSVVCRLFSQREVVSRMQIGLLTIASLLLMMTKPSYALFVLVVPFLSNSLFKTKKSAIITKLLITVTAITVLSLVSVKGLVYGDSILNYRDALTASQITLVGQIVWTITHPFDFLIILYHAYITSADYWGQSLIGNLGYNTVKTPYLLVLVSYAVLFIAALYAVSTYSRKVGVLYLMIGSLSALSVIFLLYATFNPVGSSEIAGVQGRYFIPCMPFILLGIVKFLPFRMAMSSKSAYAVFVSCAAAVLYFTLYAYIEALY